MSNTLPVPTKKYGLWARFVTDLYEHGKRHAVPAIVHEELLKIHNDIVGSYDRKKEPPQVRPSGNLACARQAYLLEKYGTEQDRDEGLGATFGAGHFFHAMAFAYCRSALPPGFSLETEKVPEKMPDWWPDRPTFKQTGHQDMVLTITDLELAGRYMSASTGSTCLTDFKGMGRWSYGKHCNSDPWDQPDGFGYMAQLATYSDGGTLYDEVVLAGINRDQIHRPLKCRVIPNDILATEMYRVRKGFDALEDGRDPGVEFFMRHGKQADFICGTESKEGACNQSRNCRAEGWPV